MLQVNLIEAANNLPALIQKAMNGEEVVIANESSQMVKLVPLQFKPLQELKPKRRLGLAKGRIKMAPDFDEPLEEFKEYM